MIFRSLIMLAILSSSTLAVNIQNLTWKETTKKNADMFIGDSEILPDAFDGIKVKLVNTSYKDTYLYDPKFIGLDFELEKCPTEEKIEGELYVDYKKNKNSIGRFSYIKVESSCKIFVTLISPFINQNSFIFATKSSKAK